MTTSLDDQSPPGAPQSPVRPVVRSRSAPSAPSAPAAASGRFGHIRALDGLRGLAVVLVVASHFAPGVAPGGFLGVDLFFVLSGFLITSLLVAERESTGRVSLRNFWLRRARRLFPALLAVVAVALVVVWVTGPPDRTHRVGADGLSSLLYVANWRFVISGQSYIRQFIDETPSPLRHTWSLAIEEQFYILWPLVLIGLTSLGRRLGRVDLAPMRRWLTGCCVVLASLSFAWLAYSYRRGTGLDRLYYGTDTRVFIILVGAALGAASAGRPFLGASRVVARVLLIGAGIIGTMALVAASIWIGTEQRWLYAGGFGLIAVVMVTVLAAAAQPGRNPLARFLEVRALVGLGLISYGVYLWHWPIAVFLDESSTGLEGWALLLVRCALTLGVSLLSYRFLERPIREGRLPRLRPIGPAVTAAMITAGVLVSLAIPVLAFPGVATAPEGQPITEASVEATSAYERAVRCTPEPEARPVAPGKELRIQLEGNSIAGEVATCLRTIIESRGGVLEQKTDDYLVCDELPRIERQLEDPATRPDAVIAFMFTAYDSRCGSPWNTAIDRFVELYRTAGVHVFLVPSVPVVPGARDDLARGPELEDEHYRDLAARYPDDVTYVDGGVFLRDTSGEYRWRMPCLSGGEPGCDEDGTVVVRFTDGVHFCSDPEFPRGWCSDPLYQGGEKRASAGIAAGVLPRLEQLFG